MTKRGITDHCPHGAASRQRSDCRKCYKTDYMRNWYKKEGKLEEARLSVQIYHRRCKVEAIERMGGACECCGETHAAFLSVDHVDGKGKEHRAEIGAEGRNMWVWLIRNNFPPGFRLLCLNCNIGAYRNDNVCPHEEVKTQFEAEHPE